LDESTRAGGATRWIASRARDVARQGPILAVVFGPLLVLPYAMWRLWQEGVTPADVALLASLYVLTGLGITVGFHRFLTHRSFATNPVLKAVFLILGSMTMQGRCIDWAATHLKHHAHSDREGDPHSPVDGFFHAHMGWLLTAWPANRAQYGRYLLTDPLVVWIDRTTYFWVAVGLVIPYLVDGWRGVLWGGAVRIVLYNQVTYAVNSVCHCFGTRSFDTKDQSRNNLLIAILAMGEGWHNNHHAFPSMAFHGMTRAQVDVSAAIIRFLMRRGLVWNVKLPSPDLVARRAVGPVSTGSVVDRP
jgi:stearoyl-CoA desaturase (delta-9 desaturase)